MLLPTLLVGSVSLLARKLAGLPNEARTYSPRSSRPVSGLARHALSAFQRRVVECLCGPWLAGAGLKKGFAYGKSDAHATFPDEHPVRPEDLSATIFHLLGIAPHSEVRDALNRPLAISAGSVIDGILA